MKKSRWKNPWFYITFIGLFLTATRIEPSTLTSWQALGKELYGFISNPFLIGTSVVALVGHYMNPTTPGITDKQ
jgi:Predicted membrane protein